MADIIATIPVSSLRRTPPGYTPPLWRWLLLPASMLLLKHYGGVWISGSLHLTDEDVRFTPTKIGSTFHKTSEAWQIPFGDIREIDFAQALVMDTIDLHHPGGVQRLKSARSADFVEKLRAAVSAAG